MVIVVLIGYLYVYFSIGILDSHIHVLTASFGRNFTA